VNTIEFISAAPNLPFSIALAAMLIIAFLEGLGTLFGMGVSSLIEGLLPDLDLDFDADVSGGDSPIAMSRFLGWLRFGKVPALILLVVFLTAFGLIGLGLQKTVHAAFGLFMPGVLVCVVAFAASLPVVRVLGEGLARILPKDETSAVSEKTFIGRVATIILGTAKQGSPAEAKLQDQHGQAHYVMVEPDLAEDEFQQGDQVLLVNKAGRYFRAIRNTSENLVD
jgi:Inner membrane protein YqiJ, N-terminal/Inner membrane protein YqiJ, OB-fold